MEGGVDAAGPWVQAEDAVAVERHNLVFVQLFLCKLRLKRQEAVEVEGGEAVLADGSEVAP